MTNKSSNLDATASVSFLKDQISQMQSMFTHLHSVIGGEIGALDRTYVKGQNVKPIVPHIHTLKTPASPFSAGTLLSDFVGDAARMAGGSGGGSSDASQGQIWADAASVLSRAMKRYL